MNTGNDLSVAGAGDFQMENATKAVKTSYTVVGLQGRDAVVLVVDKLTSKPDVDGRLLTIDQHIGMAVTGLVADGDIVAEMASKQASKYRELYATAIPVKTLCENLAGFIYTQFSDVRPFDVAVTLASWDHEDGPQLYQIEFNGSFYGFSISASGKLKVEALDEMEHRNLLDMDKDELVKSAGEIIYKIHDELPDGKFRLEMGIVGQSTEGLHVINPAELTEMACSAGEAAKLTEMACSAGEAAKK